jgi:hypothetical protein
MTVRCAHCNEEMLGAVNRCWRCGHSLVANSQQSDLPPRRRNADLLPASPPSANPAMIAEAEVLDDEDEMYEAQPVESAENGSVAVASRQAMQQNAPPQRIEPPVSVPERADTAYRHPAHHPTPATGGALGSLLLGIVSLIVAFFTWTALLLALGGLALGAWGVSSNRRGTALVGMLLCCIALLLGGFNGAVGIYETVYGRKPWEPAYPPGYEETIDGSLDSSNW